MATGLPAAPPDPADPTIDTTKDAELNPGAVAASVPLGTMVFSGILSLLPPSYQRILYCTYTGRTRSLLSCQVPQHMDEVYR